MDVDVHASPQSVAGRRPEEAVDGPPRTRAVLAALAVGAAAALVLPLVVLPGASEAVSTGAALMGFGLGWATLYRLSGGARATSQRWAAVLAAAMTASGAALVLLAPPDATLTMLGWVWPPAALGLAAWALVRARRSLRGAGRWLVTAVLVVLAAASVGATVQDVVAVRTEHAHPAPGVLHDVGGHALHLDCRGSGAPTVVLLNGLGEFSASWSRVVDGVEPTTRVCAYDRAGQGWSADADGPPQDGVAAVEDLRALLASAGERGPFVLAGHSMGGPYAMVHAARHPTDVAGMVLLDSASPDQFTDLPDYPLQYALMRRAYGVLPTLARLGLGPLLAGSGLPAEDAATVEAISATPRAATNSRDELTVLPDVLRQARDLTSLGHMPLVVLTSTENAQDTDGWTEAQERMAALSPDVDRVEVATSHAGVVDTPRGAAASVAAIRSVVAAVRDGSPTS